MADGPELGIWIRIDPDAGLVLDDHRKNVRSFVAQVDPTTGYIEDT